MRTLLYRVRETGWIRGRRGWDRLLDAKHGVAERPELSVDERLMTPVGGSPIDGVSTAVCHAPVATGSAIQEDGDVFLRRELPDEVFAQARLVARDNEVVPGHDDHGGIFHETFASVKIGGADPGRVGPSAPFWKDGGGCRACRARVRGLLPNGP